jgi:hypothetical protein
MELSGQLKTPAALTLEGAPGTHCVGGWMGSRALWTLWGTEKCLAPVGNRTLAVQPVTHRYTDGAKQ